MLQHLSPIHSQHLSLLLPHQSLLILPYLSLLLQQLRLSMLHLSLAPQQLVLTSHWPLQSHQLLQPSAPTLYLSLGGKGTILPFCSWPQASSQFEGYMIPLQPCSLQTCSLQR